MNSIWRYDSTDISSLRHNSTDSSTDITLRHNLTDSVADVTLRHNSTDTSAESMLELDSVTSPFNNAYCGLVDSSHFSHQLPSPRPAYFNPLVSNQSPPTSICPPSSPASICPPSPPINTFPHSPLASISPPVLAAYPCTSSFRTQSATTLSQCSTLSRQPSPIICDQLSSSNCNQLSPAICDEAPPTLTTGTSVSSCDPPTLTTAFSIQSASPVLNNAKPCPTSYIQPSPQESSPEISFSSKPLLPVLLDVARFVHTPYWRYSPHRMPPKKRWLITEILSDNWIEKTSCPTAAFTCVHSFPVCHITAAK